MQEDKIHLQPMVSQNRKSIFFVPQRQKEKVASAAFSFCTFHSSFATDWPCSRSVAPDDIVMQYLAIVDQMDFSTEEMHQIAHRNAEELFHIHINR
ncbi:MAG: hypothetical protein IKI69_00880 [Oscillospiraceae bacterium]|nr:hypothetical protein [Oscillospiraceae bacterium]